MIEVLFAESEACAMKIAKNTVPYRNADGPVSVWTAGGKLPPEKKHSGWIEGTKDEVVCLCYMLDIGDIRQDIDSRYRRNLIRAMYGMEELFEEGQDFTHPYGMEELFEEGQDFTHQCMQMEKLKAYLKAGASIRIWYSDAPYSSCGLYHLCHVLRSFENEVFVVKLPEYTVYKEAVISYKNWGEAAAEDFAGFLTSQKALSKAEICRYAALWSELAEDNSPLRAVVNGRAAGVPEYFYDFMIFQRLTREPVKEGRLIGSIISSQINIGDGWFAQRIQHFIETGTIKVWKEAEKSYERWICMAG